MRCIELSAHPQADTIVFRDMKPSNVMINQQDHVVLVDFGIASPLNPDKKAQ